MQAGRANICAGANHITHHASAWPPPRSRVDTALQKDATLRWALTRGVLAQSLGKSIRVDEQRQDGRKAVAGAGPGGSVPCCQQNLVVHRRRDTWSLGTFVPQHQSVSQSADGHAAHATSSRAGSNRPVKERTDATTSPLLLDVGIKPVPLPASIVWFCKAAVRLPSAMAPRASQVRLHVGRHSEGRHAQAMECHRNASKTYPATQGRRRSLPP